MSGCLLGGMTNWQQWQHNLHISDVIIIVYFISHMTNTGIWHIWILGISYYGTFFCRCSVVEESQSAKNSKVTNWVNFLWSGRIIDMSFIVARGAITTSRLASKNRSGSYVFFANFYRKIELFRWLSWWVSDRRPCNDHATIVVSTTRFESVFQNVVGTRAQT